VNYNKSVSYYSCRKNWYFLHTKDSKLTAHPPTGG